MGTFIANPQVFRASLKFCLFLFLGLSVSSCIHGQNISKKAQKYFAEGMEHLNWDRFTEAESSFLNAIKEEPSYTDAMEKLADVYEMTARFDNAYETMTKLISLNPKNIQYTNLRMAKLCLATYHFDEGLNIIEKLFPKGIPASANMVHKLKTDLQFAKEYISTNTTYKNTEIRPLNSHINTNEPEYFPTITADGNKLFFSRHVGFGTKTNHEDIFVSTWTGSDWGLPVGISPNVNSPFGEAAATISTDGRKLFLTICKHPNNYGGCDIWTTFKIGDIWLDPQNIGAPINSPAKETAPCLSSDGRSLYFVSDRKGGFGQLDIWVSHLQDNGKWSEPENLGPNINTPQDELRPFIHPDNKTLYFSSGGFPGFGNADIYMSKRDANEKWQSPINIGPPVNSFENDEGIFVSLDGKTGYFYSDRFSDSARLTKRNYDLFSFNLRKELAPNEVTFVKGIVMDEKNNKIAAKIDFIELDTKVKVNSTISDEKNGEYLLTLEAGKDYAMNISREGHMFYSENFSLKNLKPNENFKLNANLKKIKAGEKAVLKNIFFEYNSSGLKKQSEAELEILVEFMEDNPSLKIEISGHTDSIGSAEFNQELSEKRAKVVYDFLIGNKIPTSRLSYVGYGKSQPVATNETEAGRALNRRTEFKIISN